MAAKLSIPYGDRSPVVEMIGGPPAVIHALTTTLTGVLGYRPAPDGELPDFLLIVDAMDDHADDVVLSYVRAATALPRWPIPLFLTARLGRFRRRGLCWEEEFLFAAGTLNVADLDVRIRMLLYMWGNTFPADIVRDAVVGSFRMMMQLDADDYHHRSNLVEDLQKSAEWDGRSAAPALRIVAHGRWKPPLEKDHPYATLFRNAYSQIVLDIEELITVRNRHQLGTPAPLERPAPQRIRDLANTILGKIPRVSGRAVHSLGDARPHVVVIDDEAADIVAALESLRVGFEPDSTALGDLFHLIPEHVSLHGDPPYPKFFDAETWIRSRVTGKESPGSRLIDIRCADLILLDLSLDQAQESELAGFILLEKLRKAIPDIPLVIHTASAALGHIIEAIRNGADWYVRKEAALAYSDLASILQDIGRRPEWKRRARRLEFDRRVTNEAELAESSLNRDEYLFVWRALTADLPSGDLYVRPYAIGKSGAVTCSVELYDGPSSPNPTAHRAIPTIVAKIDRPHVMLSERERFRRFVRPLIGNRAGRIDSDVIYAGPKVAGIAYTLSGLHQGQNAPTAIQTLGTFLKVRLGAKHSGFADVTGVFHELLYDLLPTLHDFSPAGERSAWADPLFDETMTLRDSHELRLPPRFEIDLSTFANASGPGSESVLQAAIGSELHLPLCRIQKFSDDDFTVVFSDVLSGNIHRAKLTGDVARFIARFRTLRPNRALSVTGRVVGLRDNVYAALCEDLQTDFDWLRNNDYPIPTENVEFLLDTLAETLAEKIGIIHGDLNLNNIIIDVNPFGDAVRGALWLIDFGRTRRDSLAHDFAELEAEVVTQLMSSIRAASPLAMVGFFGSLDAGPLHNRQEFNETTKFVSDACQFIRRAASAAGIEEREYLATLAMDYLTLLKLNAPVRMGAGHDTSTEVRRWCIAGASAAIRELEESKQRATILQSARLPILRTQNVGDNTRRPSPGAAPRLRG